MAVMDLQSMGSQLTALGQRKVKTVYFLMMLCITFSLLVLGWVLAFTLFRTAFTGSAAEPIDAVGFTGSFAIIGDDESMLVKPMDVAVSSNRIYVTDTSNHRVQVFTLAGQPLFSFGSAGQEPGSFRFPYGIVITADNEVFVADSHNGSISVFDADGNFQRYFAAHEAAITQPAGLYLHEELLYVSNLNPGSVLVFELETERLVRTIGSPGEGVGQLRVPNDVVVGPDGKIYVSDTGNNRIQIFTLTGEFVKTKGIRSEFLYSPRGISFNSKGQLLVASKMFNEISVFDESGHLVTRFGEHLLMLPNGLTFDGSGRLYVTDHTSVVVFE